jgi:cytochrome P450
VDNLITILFGGFDTSSITLTYALYMTTQHRDVERRVVEEVLRYSRVAPGSVTTPPRPRLTNTHFAPLVVWSSGSVRRSVLGKDGQPTYEMLMNQLPYCTAVINEVPIQAPS